MKKLKKLLSLLLVSSTAALAGCGGQEPAKVESTPEEAVVEMAAPEPKKDPVVIRYGSHCASEEDPYYKDPATGEYAMAEDEREIRIEALEKVKEDLNVDLQFVQYPGDVTEVLLQSVMAGDPICDIARIYSNGQGVILEQNVLQPIDEYVQLLGENPPPKIYGKQYFMSIEGNNLHPLSPLMYNINYIEQVDALKENGKTVYPTDLYKEGKWTWSVFEDYLAKIDAHFMNSSSPQRPEQRIEAYWTDYRDVALQAMHATGSSIYGDKGLEIATDQTKKAIAYMTKLYDKGLMKSPQREGSSKPDSSPGKSGFINGEAVFCNLEDWRSGEATTAAADRGDSIGFIPFPRPDDMRFDDPNYRQVRNGGESYGIVRGVPADKVPLAIQSFKLYNDTLKQIREEMGAPTQSSVLNFDTFHPVIGEDMKVIYEESIGKTYVNELSNVLGIHVDFNDIVGRALYGMDNTPKFDVAIESEKATIETRIADMEKLLGSGAYTDNIAPKIEQSVAESYAFPVGQAPDVAIWKEKFVGTDNVDGTLDMSVATFDTTGCQFGEIGAYAPGIKVSVKDAAGNETVSEYPIVIYRPDHKDAPTLEFKPEYRTIALEEDPAAISWKDDFVEVAQDVDGLDLKGSVAVALSELDTQTAGEYVVKVTITDYVGNQTTKDLKVQVK
ncbi:MAG: hypothetical protein ACRCW2_15160 [Cellulosilyticaceae bacterium]